MGNLRNSTKVSLSDDLEGLRANPSPREAVKQVWPTPWASSQAWQDHPFPKNPLSCHYLLAFQK